MDETNEKIQNLKTFRAEFAEPAHNIQLISTAEDFATEQLKNSLAQANFWLGVAHSWATEAKQDDDYFTDLWDAIHYTGMAQLRITD